MIGHAIAGAYKNNCSFHCLAHCIFSNDEATLQNLFLQFPAYTELMLQFQEYYQLEGDFDRDDFIKLTEKFIHPADREILLGQVFRKLLQHLYEKNPDFQSFDKEETEDEKLVSDDLFAKMCNLFGVRLIIYPTDDENPDFALDYSENLPHYLTLKVFHTEKGGGHYNFSYSNPLFDLAHNQEFKKPDAYGQILPAQATRLFNKTNIVGTEKQYNAIKEEVQTAFAEMNKAHKPW